MSPRLGLAVPGFGSLFKKAIDRLVVLSELGLVHVLLCAQRSKGNIWCLSVSISTLLYEIGPLTEPEVWGFEHRSPFSLLVVLPTFLRSCLKFTGNNKVLLRCIVVLKCSTLLAHIAEVSVFRKARV